MLHELAIRGFKRFQDQRLRFAPLTLLTGFNSGGKSSAVQALQLLGLTLATRKLDPSTAGPTVTVPLNKGSLALGDLRSVVNETVSGNIFSITASGDGGEILGEYGGGDSERDSLAIPCVLTESSASAPKLDDLRRSLMSLRFVPADRLGPAEVYPLQDPHGHEIPGTRAEMTFGNLWHLRGSDLRNPRMRHPDGAVPATFDRQVELLLQELFPGATLETRPVQFANLMSLGIRTSAELGFHRPTNVGFGISYVLPVLIVLLLARPGDIIVVENPESHLHPRAQARIGRLFAQAATSGVQVIVESHSDHVLNGIRVAVHDRELTAEQVSILFFVEPSDSSTNRVTDIRVKPDGRLSTWPAGFFDEGERLLDRLLDAPG